MKTQETQETQTKKLYIPAEQEVIESEVEWMHTENSGLSEPAPNSGPLM